MFLVEVLQKSLPNSLYPFAVRSLLAHPAWLGYACVVYRGFGALQLGLASANVSC